MQHWLMKSEPQVFGIDDLAARPDQTEPWDGVRNYQARNMMRDQMKAGDQVFFYHSNCKQPAIVWPERSHTLHPYRRQHVICSCAASPEAVTKKLHLITTFRTSI